VLDMRYARSRKCPTSVGRLVSAMKSVGMSVSGGNSMRGRGGMEAIPRLDLEPFPFTFAPFKGGVVVVVPSSSSSSLLLTERVLPPLPRGAFENCTLDTFDSPPRSTLTWTRACLVNGRPQWDAP